MSNEELYNYIKEFRTENNQRFDKLEDNQRQDKKDLELKISNVSSCNVPKESCKNQMSTIWKVLWSLFGVNIFGIAIFVLTILTRKP